VLVLAESVICFLFLPAYRHTVKQEQYSF